jgi:hypothetical protein
MFASCWQSRFDPFFNPFTNCLMKKTLFSALALLGSFAALAQARPEKSAALEHKPEVEIKRHGTDDSRTKAAAPGQTVRAVAQTTPLSGAAKGAAVSTAAQGSRLATQAERPERNEHAERPERAERAEHAARPERPERPERAEHAGGHDAGQHGSH